LTRKSGPRHFLIERKASKNHNLPDPNPLSEKIVEDLGDEDAKAVGKALLDVASISFN
jgi:hypothetical protein